MINLLWDAIAAKGFEKDTYFGQAAIDIRALPKLEGTVHVNIALIVKFMPNFFFNPAEYPPVPRQDEPRNDDFLFHQGRAGGLVRSSSTTTGKPSRAAPRPTCSSSPRRRTCSASCWPALARDRIR